MPPPGPLARFGAAWLGWDMARAEPVVQPDVPGLDLPRITAGPRRYGLHATLKAPFRLAEGRSGEELAEAVAELAARLAPARAQAMVLARLGRFLALVPEGDAGALGVVAAAAVAGLDGFRAAPSEAELARRRAGGLSPNQEAMLLRWGYPHAMGTFRLHVTLTGPLAPGEAEAVEAALVPRLAALPLRPFALDAIAHVAEGADGRFRLLRRYPLSG